MPARLGGVALAVALLAACCPIPMQREVTVRPELELAVTTPEGTPAKGAKLVIRRVVTGPPPGEEANRWEERADDQGRLHLDEIRTRERYAPLMMHGVNWYGWEVCATDPKYGAANARYDGRTPVVGQVVRLDLVFDTSRMDCGWESLRTWDR